MKILVCGGRDFSDRDEMFRSLDELRFRDTIDCVIHGGAVGADTLAGEWAVSRGVPVHVFPISREDWAKYGKRAGHKRNADMLAVGQPDLVVVFPGGSGTRDMLEHARAAKVDLLIHGGGI